MTRTPAAPRLNVHQAWRAFLSIEQRVAVGVFTLAGGPYERNILPLLEKTVGELQTMRRLRAMDHAISLYRMESAAAFSWLVSELEALFVDAHSLAHAGTGRWLLAVRLGTRGRTIIEHILLHVVPKRQRALRHVLDTLCDVLVTVESVSAKGDGAARC